MKLLVGNLEKKRDRAEAEEHTGWREGLFAWLRAELGEGVTALSSPVTKKKAGALG